MPHAFLLGGTGQIGQATAEHLLDGGWTVTVAHRGSRSLPLALVERGAKSVVMDREKPGELAHALSAGSDVLIDCVAYDAEHARQLLEVQGDLGSMIVISSSSVYRDAAGRTLDEAAETGFPELPCPIPESHMTVDPGPETYSTRKVALELELLDETVTPLTILRPAAISGSGSTHAREWWFVKRILDRRPFIPLAYGGRSRFHTTSVTNIAALVNLVVRLPGQRVLNIADPSASSVSEIADQITHHLNFSGQTIKLQNGDTYPPVVGRTPWSVPRPVRAQHGRSCCPWIRNSSKLREHRPCRLQLAH